MTIDYQFLRLCAQAERLVPAALWGRAILLGALRRGNRFVVLTSDQENSRGS